MFARVYMREKELVMSKRQPKIETTCVQGGYTTGNGEPRQVPIVQITTFKYATS